MVFLFTQKLPLRQFLAKHLTRASPQAVLTQGKPEVFVFFFLAEVHGEPYILFSTDIKSLGCIMCFRKSNAETRPHFTDLDNAHRSGVDKLEKLAKVRFPVSWEQNFLLRMCTRKTSNFAFCTFLATENVSKRRTRWNIFTSRPFGRSA